MSWLIPQLAQLSNIEWLGPLYDSKTSTLHFVDIAEHKVCIISSISRCPEFLPCFQVFHLNTENFQLDVETFDEPVSCLALRRNGEGVRGSPTSNLC